MLAAETLALSGDTLTAGRADTTFDVEAAALAGIEIRSEQCRYLSDLKPESIELTPFFSVAWPVRFDRCVTGGPILLDGKTYPRGIGAGTRTEITYSLDGRYAHFYATVGVDDRAGNRGTVVFRVLTDGRAIFESPVMNGRSAAVRLVVPLDGAKTLTLVSDFGSTVRADGNFADWADARLVRQISAVQQQTLAR